MSEKPNELPHPPNPTHGFIKKSPKELMAIGIPEKDAHLLSRQIVKIKQVIRQGCDLLYVLDLPAGYVMDGTDIHVRKYGNPGDE